MMAISKTGSLASLLAIVVLASQTGHAQQATNADAYAIANQLADELELVRERMGRPYDDSPRLPLTEVSDLELYFQVASLHRKTIQLAREVAGASPRGAGPLPTPPIDSDDSYSLLADAFEIIQVVAEAVGIEEVAEFTPRNAPIGPTGVFLVVVDINRQLNLMLHEPIGDAEVYDEVATAVTYAAALLSQHEAAPEILPGEPPFSGHKRPQDIYVSLIECIDAIARIAPAYGIDVVTLNARRNIPDDVGPGHAFDVARIVVADLVAFVNAADAEIVRQRLPSPRHIFSTEVYAVVGVLQQQLEILERVLLVSEDEL
jgi:hypothetical protein